MVLSPAHSASCSFVGILSLSPPPTFGCVHTYFEGIDRKLTPNSKVDLCRKVSQGIPLFVGLDREKVGIWHEINQKLITSE